MLNLKSLGIPKLVFSNFIRLRFGFSQGYSGNNVSEPTSARPPSIEQLTQKLSKDLSKFTLVSKLGFYSYYCQQHTQNPLAPSQRDVAASLEESLSHKLQKLQNNQLIDLIRSAHSLHRVFKPDNRLLLHLNNKLKKLEVTLTSEQALALLTVLSSMKWPAQTVCKLFAKTCTKQAMQSAQYSELVKLAILHAEQSECSLDTLATFLDVLSARQARNLADLGIKDLVLLHYLCYSDFLQKRLQATSQYKEAKAGMAEIVGVATGNLQTFLASRQRLEGLLQELPILSASAKNTIELRILSLSQNTTNSNRFSAVDLALLRTKFIDNRQLKSIVQKSLETSLLSLTPLEFSQHVDTWAKEAVQKYLDTNWTLMNLNEQFYTLYKLASNPDLKQVAVQPLKGLLQELRKQKPQDVSWNTIEKAVKLSSLYGLPDKDIDQFLDYFDEDKRQTK